MSLQSNKPKTVEYARPVKPKPGIYYRVLFGILGAVVGYFVAALAGIILIGGPQGPIPFIFTLWPVIFASCMIWGGHMDRRQH